MTFTRLGVAMELELDRLDCVWRTVGVGTAAQLHPHPVYRVMQDCQKTIEKFAELFGLSPKSRSKLKFKKPEPMQKPLAKPEPTIPPHLVGDPTRTNFASIEAEDKNLLRNVIDIWLRRWEEECFDKLLSEAEKEADNHFIEFNRAELIRVDFLTQQRGFAIGRQWGWFSSNDVRQKLNEPSIGEQGDIYLSPQNMIPADKADDLADSSIDDSGANGSKVNDSVQQANRDAIMDRLVRMRNIENEQTTRAASRGGASKPNGIHPASTVGVSVTSPP